MSALELKQFPLFAELSEEEREALCDVLEERKFSKGVPLFREGSEAEGLVLVLSGSVELASRRTSDTLQLGPGSMLGAVSLLVVGRREATAVAASACRCLLLPRTSFHRLAEDLPRTAIRLAEAIAAELASAVREGLDRLA